MLMPFFSDRDEIKIVVMDEEAANHHIGEGSASLHTLWTYTARPHMHMAHLH